MQKTCIYQNVVYRSWNRYEQSVNSLPLTAKWSWANHKGEHTVNRKKKEEQRKVEINWILPFFSSAAGVLCSCSEQASHWESSMEAPAHWPLPSSALRTATRRANSCAWKDWKAPSAGLANWEEEGSCLNSAQSSIEWVVMISGRIRTQRHVEYSGPCEQHVPHHLPPRPFAGRRNPN